MDIKRSLSKVSRLSWIRSFLLGEKNAVCDDPSKPSGLPWLTAGLSFDFDTSVRRLHPSFLTIQRPLAKRDGGA